MPFGQRLRTLRRELDLSQSELGDRAGCSVNTIRKLESDERRPSRELAQRLAAVFELPVRERAEFLRLGRGTSGLGRPSLPAPMTRLIGRDRDVAAVRAQVLAADVRLLSLIGPPGVGKTRLALQVATELQERFRDGAAFVELAAVRDPRLFGETIAQALGVRILDHGQALVEYLRTRQLLLVLDNFEQLVAAGGQLADLLAAAPSVSALVTSREALAIYGEHVYVVPTLDLPEPAVARRGRASARSPAETLFLERARAARPQFARTPPEQPVIAEICRRLEGLPLAIELAAARARSMSPRALLDQLERRLELLSVGPADRSNRQRSIRGALDWSFELLAPDERQLFARLAVFAGGATADAIAAVCDASDGHAAAALVADLADKSLVHVRQVVDSTRFGMLETIREYAHEQLHALLSASEIAALRQRHAAYFADLAERGAVGLKGAEQLVWLPSLEAEHDNFRAALAASLAAGDVQVAGRLAAALWPFWRARGFFAEGRRWLAAALDVAAGVAEPIRAELLNGAGVLALSQNDYGVATRLLTESADLCRASGNSGGLANAMNNLGWVAHESGDHARAEDLCRESLSLQRQVGDTGGEARSLSNLGMLALERGDPSAAVEFFSESARLLRRLGDSIGRVQALANLGWATQELGDYIRAADLFAEALALARTVADARGIANNLSNLALMALYSGDYPKANDLYVDSVAAFSDLGDRRGVAEAVEGVAGVAGVQGQPAHAARLFGLAEALREVIGAPLLPHDRSRYATTIATAREQLDDEAWRRAWAEGRASSVDEAVALLLA